VVGKEKGPAAARVVLGGLGLASMFWFNRDPSLDHLAVYFFGSYGLGLLVAWQQAGVVRPRTFWAYTALLVVAVAIDFRSRLLVAGVTAIVLLLAQRFGWMSRWPRGRTIDRLGSVSYSLFLVHFPVCLLVNAWWYRHLPTEPWWSLFGMSVAYGASMAAAFAFYHGVERTTLAATRARTSEAT
jgi:peptidoglycan/LPS O-acetylase OafA/YrhL